MGSSEGSLAGTLLLPNWSDCSVDLTPSDELSGAVIMTGTALTSAGGASVSLWLGSGLPCLETEYDGVHWGFTGDASPALSAAMLRPVASGEGLPCLDTE